MAVRSFPPRLTEIRAPPSGGGRYYAGYHRNQLPGEPGAFDRDHQGADRIMTAGGEEDFHIRLRQDHGADVPAVHYDAALFCHVPLHFQQKGQDKINRGFKIKTAERPAGPQIKYRLPRRARQREERTAMEHKKKISVAIDGPSGAGTSSNSRFARSMGAARFRPDRPQWKRKTNNPHNLGGFSRNPPNPAAQPFNPRIGQRRVRACPSRGS